MFTFSEFFAGGGMVRAGLGSRWTCQFANDYDPKKCSSYEKNWGGKELICKDINELSPSKAVVDVDLVWGSFPCQDLSLAGGGAGLKGKHSGTFWPFWKLLTSERQRPEKPKLIILENVLGTLTSHDGQDFASICEAMNSGGYRTGAVVIDAQDFVPQSRRRLFFIGVRKDLIVSSTYTSDKPVERFHTQALIKAYDKMSVHHKKNWTWWSLPEQNNNVAKLSELIEADSENWNTKAQTKALLAMMSKGHKQKLRQALADLEPNMGTIFKRMRTDDQGAKIQRAELRLDGVAGCLRTPGGGSSKQTLVLLRDGEVKTRLLSPRETARLMGLSDDYILPENASAAYHLTGDGVVVPVVAYLANSLVIPILMKNGAGMMSVA